MDLHTTVLELKEKIETLDPGKPSVAAQKLVFKGRILKDGDSLEACGELRKGLPPLGTFLTLDGPAQ